MTTSCGENITNTVNRLILYAERDAKAWETSSPFDLCADESLHYLPRDSAGMWRHAEEMCEFLTRFAPAIVVCLRDDALQDVVRSTLRPIEEACERATERLRSGDRCGRWQLWMDVEVCADTLYDEVEWRAVYWKRMRTCVTPMHAHFCAAVACMANLVGNSALPNTWLMDGFRDKFSDDNESGVKWNPDALDSAALSCKNGREEDRDAARWIRRVRRGA